MIGNMKRSALALGCGFLFAWAPQGAAARCSLGGTWHFFAMEGDTPGISTTNQNVVVGPTLSNIKNVRVFKNSSYSNQTSIVINCTMKLNASGVFTGAPCDSYEVDGGSHAVTVSGKFDLTPGSCDFTGNIDVGGDPVPVAIKSGHINRTNGAGIATQGTEQVLYFTLVKD